MKGELWRLRDPEGKPPGVMGWWPSRSVTFIENHDTGSTQVYRFHVFPFCAQGQLFICLELFITCYQTKLIGSSVLSGPLAISI